MKSFLFTALVASLVAAEQDVFLKEELLVRHLATGDKVAETDGRPNASARTEAACNTLNGNTDSIYYEYQWNTDGCFCEHIWKTTAPYYDWWSNCDNTSGDILNPYHEINNRHDRCLTLAEYDACEHFDSCAAAPEPTPPIEECAEAFGNADAQPKGHASAYIVHDYTDRGDFMYDGSGFETGWIEFTETCGMGKMCGTDYCIGTCVEGAMWGMLNGAAGPDFAASKFAVHINEFGVLDDTHTQLAQGLGICAQTGSVWNPDELAHGLPSDPIHPPGALGNLEITALSDSALPFSSSTCQ